MGDATKLYKKLAFGRRNRGISRDMGEVIMQPSVEDRKIIIGLVISQLSIGGAERQIYELAVGLERTCVYRPVVICYSNYRHPNGLLLEREGIHVVYPDAPLNYVSKLAWIRKQLLDNHCRIAYAFLNPTNIYCWLACVGTNIGFIASVRGLPSLNLPLRLGLKAALAGSDWIIANSESGKQWVVDSYKADPQKIAVIANAVRPINYDPEVNNSLRIELGITNNDTVIGLVSNMKAQKRPGFMLEVATEILKDNKNVHFVWVGDGPLYSEILIKYGLLPANIRQFIHFVGAKDNSEDWFSVFNVYMLISEWEGLSNSLMEAMSLGLPCICSDVPGIVDIIQNKQTGILVLNKKFDWLKALDDVVRNPELARYVGQNARREMVSFSPLVLAEKTSVVFDQVLAKKRTR